MKASYLVAFLGVFSACSPLAVERSKPDTGYGPDHSLMWACERLAVEYREDPKKHPILCDGYDQEGWPISGADYKLPKEW